MSHRCLLCFGHRILVHAPGNAHLAMSCLARCGHQTPPGPCHHMTQDRAFKKEKLKGYSPRRCHTAMPSTPPAPNRALGPSPTPLALLRQNVGAQGCVGCTSAMHMACHSQLSRACALPNRDLTWLSSYMLCGILPSPPVQCFVVVKGGGPLQ